MTEPSLDLLEKRVHALVEKINKLRADNHRLHDELALGRQEIAAQARELEAERSRVVPVVAPSDADAEWRKTIEHQTQEIQLLEKERLNLRDQIAFLQNTIQNKEKDWKEKTDHARAELGEQLQEKQQQLVANQERISNLELKLQVLQTDAEQAASQLGEHQTRISEMESVLTQQAEQTRVAEEKLAATQTQLHEQEEAHLLQIAELKTQHETHNLQEAERFRMEYALLGKQHEQNLSDLTQALNQQKERLREETQNAQQKLQQALQHNQILRDLLTQNAAEIRTLIARLPENPTPIAETESEANS